MSRFAGLADCTDPVVQVEASDLEQADVDVRTVLRNKSLDPEAVTDADGLALLRELAVAYATHQAAARAAADGGDTVLWRKADHYRRRAQDLSQRVNAETLGLAAAGSGAAGFGAIPLGRG